MVYPFLSKVLSSARLGELLLTMTTMNFYVTVFAPPMVMLLYRHFSEVNEESKAEFTGWLLKALLLGICLLASVNIVGFKALGPLCNLAITTGEFSWLLVYMGALGVDTFLLARVHFDFMFGKGLLSRLACFVGYMTIIPMFFMFPQGFFFSLVLGPVMGCSVLLYVLIREEKLSFKEGILGDKWLVVKRDLGWFFLSCLCSQLFVYSDRWLLASFHVTKAKIAYYIIAAQACSLILFPTEKVAELIMPSIGNLKTMRQLTKSQTKKLLGALAGTMAYIGSLGLALGYFFLGLYEESYMENGWPVFLVLMAGNFFYVGFIYSRGFLIKFYPPHFLMISFLVATVGQVGMTVLVLLSGGGLLSAALGRVFGLVAVAAIGIGWCQWPLMKIAFGKRV